VDELLEYDKMYKREKTLSKKLSEIKEYTYNNLLKLSRENVQKIINHLTIWYKYNKLIDLINDKIIKCNSSNIPQIYLNLRKRIMEEYNKYNKYCRDEDITCFEITEISKTHYNQILELGKYIYVIQITIDPDSIEDNNMYIRFYVPLNISKKLVEYIKSLGQYTYCVHDEENKKILDTNLNGLGVTMEEINSNMKIIDFRMKNVYDKPENPDNIMTYQQILELEKCHLDIDNKKVEVFLKDYSSLNSYFEQFDPKLTRFKPLFKTSNPLVYMSINDNQIKSRTLYEVVLNFLRKN
jgi:hypothetical protein